MLVSGNPPANFKILYGTGHFRLDEENRPVRVGFNIGFAPAQPFRGVHKTIGVDRSGSGDQYSQEEIVVRQLINHAGNLPQIYDDLIHVIAPDSAHTGSAMLNMARYNDVFLDSQYENGSQGTAFEYELIYYPTSTIGGVEGLKRPNPDSVQGVPIVVQIHAQRALGCGERHDVPPDWRISTSNTN